MSQISTAHAKDLWPDAGGHFGAYGGKFVPETLMSPWRNWTGPTRKPRPTPGSAGSWNGWPAIMWAGPLP